MLYYGGKVNDEIKFYTFIFINERFQCFDKTPFDTHTRAHLYTSLANLLNTH
jgi:hypothetical protein